MFLMRNDFGIFLESDPLRPYVAGRKCKEYLSKKAPMAPGRH